MQPPEAAAPVFLGTHPVVPLQVAVMGMDARRVNILEMVFAGPGGNACVIVDDELAQACIIDMDSYGAEDVLMAQRRVHPERPLVLISLYALPQEVIGRDLCVDKPLRVESLVEAVKILKARLYGGSPTHPASGSGRREGSPRWRERTFHRPGRQPSPVSATAPIEVSAGRGVVGDALHPTGSDAGRARHRAVHLREESAGLLLGAAEPEELLTRSIDLRSIEPEAVVALRSREPHPVAGPRVEPHPAAGLWTKPELDSEPDLGHGDEPDLDHAVKLDLDHAVEPDEQQEPDPHSYEPGRYLQGLVMAASDEALVRGRAVHIEGPWPTISLFPNSETVLIPGGLAALEPYAGEVDITVYGSLMFTPAPMFSPNHPDAMPLEALVWALALRASSGRLPRGTALDESCGLRDWPNFTRLQDTRGAMSITALWTREPQTMDETAERLGLPLGDVFSFYSAAAALGLVISSPKPVRTPALPESTMIHRRRGVLRRIFDKLRLG